MVKIALAASVAFAALTSAANASLVFSNVSYTSNSVTFTVNGDLSGVFAGAADTFQFSIKYGGDIVNPGVSTFHSNSWSGPVFDGVPIFNGGNTGVFSGSNFYTWSTHSTDLMSAVASNNTVSVNFTDGYLNESAGSPSISFVLGNGNDDQSSVLLGQWNGAVTSSVPLPAGLSLLTIALGTMALKRRRQQA